MQEDAGVAWSSELAEMITSIDSTWIQGPGQHPMGMTNVIVVGAKF